MNGERQNGSLLGENGNSSSLHRPSLDSTFLPLNVEPSSAPVPAHVTPGTPSSPDARKGLGRATSSKRCLILACCSVLATIGLVVGLAIGLNSGDSSSSSSSSSGGSGGTGSTGSTAVVYGASLPSQCQDLATTPYWDYVTIIKYDVNPLRLTEDMFRYSANNSTPALNFTATVTITLTVQHQPASCLILNALNMTFQSMTLQTQQDGGELSAAVDVCGGGGAPGCEAGGSVVSQPFELRASPDAATAISSAGQDLVAVSLGQELPVNATALLTVEYTGLLGSWPDVPPAVPQGLYRSAPYASANGSELQVMVVTQGETTGARRLLPCYDQPARKAVFKLTLQVPAKTPAGNDMVALSNMPLKSQTELDSGATLAVEFEESPVMSPYLFAIAAGDLQSYQPPANSSVANGTAPRFRFWAAPGLQSQLAGAAVVAPRAWEFYRSYFAGVEQPAQLSKLDMLAVPSKDGAMENWGLIMLDERRFLYDEAWEGTYGYKQMAVVVCHEIGHQWVGNLATKQDWAMLSVDEGLVSFLEYKCLNEVQGFQGQGDIHFSRGLTQQLEIPGLHDSPTFQALQVGSDPTQPPMVPASDLELGTGGFMQYSKPAALVRQQEQFVIESTGANHMPDILSLMLSRAAYSTWNWSMYYMAARDALAAVNTTGATNVAKSIEARAGTFLRAQSYDEMMQLIGNASTAPTAATWYYSPLYPIVALDENPATNAPVAVYDPNPPNPPVSNPNNATQVNLYNYNETLFAIGATSQPYCAYQLSEELAGKLGVAEEAQQYQALCSYPVGERYFPLTSALGNLTACDQSANAEAPWAPRWGELLQAQPPTWVDNQRGARLMRGLYSSEAHFDALVNVTAAMTSICATEADATKSCCTRQSDLLESAAFLNDVMALAQTGRQQPVAAGLTGVTALQAMQRAVRGPGGKIVGAPYDGAWQYLIGRSAIDTIFQLKRYAEFVAEEQPECSADFTEYALEVLHQSAIALKTDWMDGSTPTNDTLKQLAGPRSLWLLGYLGTPSLTNGLCDSFTLTPLWRRVVDAANGGAGDIGITPTPGALQPESSPEVPTDLLPALYMMGSALPAPCNVSLLNDPGIPDGTADLTDLAVPLLTALQRCYLTDPSESEAVRCLYAMPFAAVRSDAASFAAPPHAGSLSVKLAASSTLPWLLRTLNGTLACFGFTGDNVQYARCVRRSADLAHEMPALAAMLARPGAAHYSAVLSLVEALWVGPRMCNLLAALPPPVTQDTYTRLIEFLSTGPGSSCPAALKIRLAGVAEQQREVLQGQASQVCDYVAQQLEAFAAEVQSFMLSPPPAGG